MYPVTRRLGHRTQIGGQRALAVGAGDMDQRRQLLFRRIQRLQQVLNALQSKGDDPRVAVHQPLDNGVAHGEVSVGKSANGNRQAAIFGHDGIHEQ